VVERFVAIDGGSMFAHARPVLLLMENPSLRYVRAPPDRAPSNSFRDEIGCVRPIGTDVFAKSGLSSPWFRRNSRSGERITSNESLKN